MPARYAPRSALREFLASEAASGSLLVAAALLALLVANSPLAQAYFDAVEWQFGPELTPKLGPMTLKLWINDALMAVFFFVVGLEIKREFLDGHLSTWADRQLPLLAAAGGMVAPAVVFLLVVGFDPVLTRGWAIPAATDIAFALGLLALLGKRAPASLKLFLTTVAIVDDMGAVTIIALFYTASLDLAALAAAFAVLGAMFAAGRLGLRQPAWFLLGFVALWYFTLLSGVHATIGGVLAAMAVPLRKTPAAPDAEDSTLHRLEHALHPGVAYVIVPLFGFANAGVALRGAASPLSTLSIAIAVALFVGKQLGVFGAVRLAAKAGWVKRPAGATWLQVYGVALLCGIGFTMSLFIGDLAFPDQPHADEVKLGVLMGSFASAAAGFAVLRLAHVRATIPTRA